MNGGITTSVNFWYKVSMPFTQRGGGDSDVKKSGMLVALFTVRLKERFKTVPRI